MKTIIMVNKAKQESASIGYEDIAMMYSTHANDIWGYDEEVLDAKGYSSYQSVFVVMLKDGTTQYYSGDCEILFI